ncbi:MAG: translation initiation factor IF-2 [Candidatus ainarchaeum sp.]|nr:translation initiation factor IF-2 [Candidatus ainarchaeum sp.]MDD3975787.1 translation initiation factor IF-2 [Candidatus ainarchaeum sp.]
MYRQPIITIMGHIDSGKTTFLDKIKGSSIAKLEAGKITQHIGATEITLDVIKKMCFHLFNKYKFDVTIPGLLFIDTPGHNAFDNLRERGGSLADLVVLVIDINKGLQAQDIETLEILKMYKVPFIILANKVDLIKGWYQEGKDISFSLSKQSKNISDYLDELIYKIVGQLYDKGFSAERFDRVSDFKKQIAIIPTSAEKEWGLTESILFLATLSQKFLGTRITIQEFQKAQGTILELGEVKGIGTAADVIIYQGILKLKDRISFLTKQGIIESKVKALLKINVLSAINKKTNFENVEFVSAASGVKIIAPDLDKCLPGSVIVSSEDLDAIKNLKERPLSCVINSEQEGAFIKTDTLGSLEALTKLLEKNNICIAKADIGEVTQKDYLELKILNEQNKKKGVLFLFNSKISKDLEEKSEKDKIPIFKNNIIYKLIEDYNDWLLKINDDERNKILKEIVYPCKFKILKNHIFRTSKPAIVGIKVLIGKLVVGARIINSGNKEIGVIQGIQNDGKAISVLEEEKESAISIKNAVYLKDFKEEDVFEVLLTNDSLEKLDSLKDELTDKELELISKAKMRRYSL